MKKITEIINSLQISETMFSNAEEKYISVAKFLMEKIGGANVYTQGSFAIGATTRPYKDGKELSYDIDLILEVERNKLEQDGDELLKEVYNILNENVLYKGKLELGEKSITIKYADIDGIGFTLDVVPAVKESIDVKEELIAVGGKEEYINDAVAISSLDKTDKDGWYTATPKGYIKWFEEINFPYKMHLFENMQRDKYGKIVYNSIEEVPYYKIKTPVQEAVQFFKRVRDIYYSKRKQYDKRPISAIITTIVASVASRNSNYRLTVVDLIMDVIKELKTYNEYNFLTEEEFYVNYPNYVDIKKNNGKWEMINPTNPKDNLVDSWNSDKSISKLFFEWLDIIDEEVAKIIANPKDIILYENLFGTEVVSKLLGNEIKENILEGPKPYGEC